MINNIRTDIFEEIHLIDTEIDTFFLITCNFTVLPNLNEYITINNDCYRVVRINHNITNLHTIQMIVSKIKK